MSGPDDEFEIVRTRSGGVAVRDRSGELMHPVGALVEASNVYVDPSNLEKRLAEDAAEPLVLYDVGLGAGSNAAAAWRLSENRGAGRRLHIVSFDRTFSAVQLAIESPHSAELGFDADSADAARELLHRGNVCGSNTWWRAALGHLPDTLESQPKADVVFWDPFSSKTNPELWTVAAFSAVYRQCRRGATLHTYSASTRVRAAMILAGFQVGYGTSTGNKEATTVAALSRQDLLRPLDRRWLARLERSTAPLPTDAPDDSLSKIKRVLGHADG